MRINAERDLTIVSQWNAEKSYTDIGILHQISRNSVSGAIRDARKRGEVVRAAVRHFGGTRGEAKLKRTRSPAKAKAPRQPAQRRKQTAVAPPPQAHKPEPVQVAHDAGSLGIQLRQARLHYSSRTLDDCLPEHSKQCRWLHGDLLDGGIQSCKLTRERVDLALLDDPFPYCELHRKAAIYKPPRTTVATAVAATPRVLRSKYGYSYAATAS